tara:strand:+ start:465 stop:662 length:198 start_codon:yes stop_codon:yes gene_type:complete
MSQNYTDLSKERSTRETSSDQTKRTDVNILLNRVRLDKKRDFQKNILFSLLLFGLICLISIYLII